MTAPLPRRCPSCAGDMIAETARCEVCGIEVNGRFAACPVCTLTGEDRRLFSLFLSSRGNLKKVERALGISYPTVRQRMDELLSRIGWPRRPALDRLEVLRRLRTGEIDVEEAERQLS